ncbi:hypothetical protein KP509_08G010800 [Ceratopteris richardii]|uniref:Germin-like protein n=1 Tax=Ceratopteris richardii TaxID=49495 RepID=A0A8T2U3J0_CERRI|nr:hypothetical protein KP509_08G010800 [Ceratopteris richardii]
MTSQSMQRFFEIRKTHVQWALLLFMIVTLSSIEGSERIRVFDNFKVLNNSVHERSATGFGADYFMSRVLNKTADMQTAAAADGVGCVVVVADSGDFPALTPHSLSMARTLFAPKGLYPPHVHPTATELVYVAEGSLLAGFIDPVNNSIYQQSLYNGELFFFPRGVLHFLLNVNADRLAITISVFNDSHASMS